MLPQECSPQLFIEHGRLAHCLRSILDRLPEDRTWLDPRVEHESRALLAAIGMPHRWEVFGPKGVRLFNDAVERIIDRTDYWLGEKLEM